MFPNRLQFEHLFFGLQNLASEIQINALLIILNLLPDLDLPPKIWTARRHKLALTPAFARDATPLAVRLLVAKAARDSLVLALFAACLMVSPFEPRAELLSALAGLLQTPACVAYVLLVCKHLPDSAFLVRAKIIPLLQEAVSTPDINDWFVAERNRFIAAIGTQGQAVLVSDVAVSNFDELCDFALATDLVPFQFRNSSLLEQTLLFLGHKPAVTPRHVPALEKITALVHGALEFLPDPTIQESYAGPTREQLCGKSVHGDLTTPEEEVKGIGIGLDLDFAAIEAWYNGCRNRVTKNALVVALDASEYKDMIELYNRNQISFTTQGLLRRGLGDKPPGSV
jgi:hypothetical protein